MGKHSARDGQDGWDHRENPEGPGNPGSRHTSDHRESVIPGGFPRGPVPPGVPAPPAFPVPPVSPVRSGALTTPGTGRRRRGDSPDDTGAFTVLGPRDAAGRPQPHPEHREHSAWGAGGRPGQVVGRPSRAPGPHGSALDAVEEWAEDWEPYDTAAMRPAAVTTPGLPPTRLTSQGGRTVPRPRQEFVDAFDLPAPAPAPTVIPVAPTPLRRVGERQHAEPPPTGDGPGGVRSGGWGRTLSGVAAAAVVTVLAVVVGGQVAGEKHHTGGPPETGPATGDTPRATPSDASRSVARGALPATTAASSYDELMSRTYPLDPELRLSGAFTTVPGHQAAPGGGKVVRFRVDVERGLPLDAALFSDAVFKTLNDPRSWGHGGTMSFERVSTGPADIVVTLASPGTTEAWCQKSGLDTGAENVSCDAASTPRTMINAYRWAQGAATYGPRLMESYRQMLINHEVGHRLGHDHAGCPKEGALAPVMMQQTKFLSLDGGPTCKPNAWPYP